VRPCWRVDESTLPKILRSACFSKDRPFVAPESPSPLPKRCPALARRPRLIVSRLPPPDCSDPVVSRHFADFLLVNPVRAVAAAHDPGVHRRFTERFRHFWPPLPDPRDCFSALRSFPSVDGRRRRAMQQAARFVGEAFTSGPVVTPLCCSVRPRPRRSSCTSPCRFRPSPRPTCSLEACQSRHPARCRARPRSVSGASSLTRHCTYSSLRSAHALREFTNRLTASPFSRLSRRSWLSYRSPHHCGNPYAHHSAASSTANLAVFLHRRVRCTLAVSSSRARCSHGLGLFLSAFCGASP